MKVFIPEIKGVTISNPLAHFLIKKPHAHNEELVEKLDNADVVLNPVKWKDYFKQVQSIKRYIHGVYEKADKAGPYVVSVNLGDYWFNFPEFALAPNSIILSQTGDRSINPSNVKGFPVYWKNALKKFYKRNTISPLSKPEMPTVAFCGYAHSAWGKNLVLRAQNDWQNWQYKLGFSNFTLNQTYPAPLLRDKILNTCEASNLIKTDFIRRTQYKGGFNNPVGDKGFAIQQEFYDNIFNNPYVLCVRGNGNFSVRFYETLALGRIPVVYDTRQLWPYEDFLDYNKTCVIIDAEKEGIESIPEKVADFHEHLSDEDFKAIQERNRELFIQYMRMPDILKHFKELIGYV